LYAPGFEVEGVNWERDFSEYTLRIKNNHKKVQILDLRAEMRLLAGFVKASTVSLQGVEDVHYSRTGFTGAGRINEQGQMYESIKSYGTNQLITAAKMFANGEFTTKFILKRVTPTSRSNTFNVIILKFLYIDFWGETVGEWIAYRVNIERKGALNILSVDSRNPIPGKNVSPQYSMFFDKPVTVGKEP